jgi:predicted nucleic-acid-binding protein
LIALDTNLLVRFLTRDDPGQAAEALDVMGGLTPEEPGFVCREVLVELVWVLERAYKYPRAEITRALEGLLSASELVIEASGDVGAILHLYEGKGFGFSDLMIRQAARRSGAEVLVTFDMKAAQLDGVELPGGDRRQ